MPTFLVTEETLRETFRRWIEAVDDEPDDFVEPEALTPEQIVAASTTFFLHLLKQVTPHAELQRN
jgi:hypothetical protein